MEYGNFDALIMAGYARSDGIVRLLFQAYVRCLDFLAGTFGREYPRVDFQFVGLGGWLRISLHAEVRNDELCRGGVELSRYVRFAPAIIVCQHGR